MTIINPPLIISIFIGLVVAVFGSMLLLVFFLTKHQFGWRVARLHTLLVAAGLGVIFGGAALIVYAMPDDWRSFSELPVQLATIVLVWSTIGLRVFGRSRAGAVLLDLGPTVNRRLFFGVAALPLLLALLSVFTGSLDGNFDLANAVMVLMMLSIGVSLTLHGLDRFQIRERGVWYGQCITWNNIRSFGWDTEKPGVLILQGTSRLAFASKVHLPVPPEHRPDVEQLLTRYIPHRFDQGAQAQPSA